MLDKKGFDLWADGYDKSVGLSDEKNVYPFAGYKKVLNFIYNAVLSKNLNRAKVLDIGFGTGTLTKKLYDGGCEITGADFSDEMIKLAIEKMPEARLFKADFSKGLPGEITAEKYDFIVATYSLHHLTDAEKIPFLKSLQEILKDGGEIFVGDVAFENRAKLNECREDCGDDWDGDEFYFVYNEIKEFFGEKIEFEKSSFCAGVLKLTK